MSRTPYRPKARRDLIVSELTDEALIYDFATHRAHCVDDAAYRVFKLCDGTRGLDQITVALSGAAGIDADRVRAAIDELAGAGLLEASELDNVDLARRRAMKQVAITAGLSVALPMVWSILAPTVAEAASTRVPCVGSGSCKGMGGECCGTSGGGSAGTCSGGTCSSGGACMGSTCQ